MRFTDQQIESISPNAAAFSAGKKLSPVGKWETKGKSARVIWGTIKGSGKNPYYAQIDIQSLAYKCTCPSRQFPCKHAIGLMLLHGEDGSAIAEEEEPDWVLDWINKRQVRLEKEESTEAKEKTPEEEEKSKKNKEKTQENRLKSVQEGAAELQLWLIDLLRVGLLELPNKKPSEFKKIQARMLDAKAPALAGWIRTLAATNFSEEGVWQEKVLKLLAKLNLLLKAIRNIEHYDELWQLTIKNLSGWTQSPKELKADENAERIKDHWLCVGQTEETNDDIVTQRTWLYGVQSQRQALVLNFATRYSSFESILMAGSILEAELLFFPSVQLLRAVVGVQKGVEAYLPDVPLQLLTIEEMMQMRKSYVLENPWFNDQVVVLQNCVLRQVGASWYVVGDEGKMLSIASQVLQDKCLNFMAMTGNTPSTLAGVYVNDTFLPFGLIQNQNYFLL